MKFNIKNQSFLFIVILWFLSACFGKGISGQNTQAPKVLFENGKWAAEVGTVTTVIPGGTSVLEYQTDGHIRIFNGSGDTFTSFTFKFSQNVDMGPHNRLIIELATPFPVGGWVGAGAVFRDATDSYDNTFLWWGGNYYNNGVFTLDGITHAPSSGDGIGSADNWLADRLNGFNLTPLDNNTMIIKRIYVDSAPIVPINIAVIPGLGIPRTGGTPVTKVETAQYTGIVEWSPAMDGNGKFADGVIYTAIITLTPKSSFLLQGVPANFFTVSTADSVANSAGSSTVTATFTQTGIPYPTPTKFVALTFDDGPTGTNTIDLLNILDDWDNPVPATWFVLGRLLGYLGDMLYGEVEEAMLRKVARGDEFANHTWSHLPNGIGSYNREQLEEDFKITQERILELTGQNVKWFRHPRYDSTPTSLDILSSMGLACIRNGINGDPNDWNYSVNASMLVDRMTNDSALYDGQVFLLHDLSQASTVEALVDIIHVLKTKGVGFMTLSQLQAHTGKVVTPGTVIFDLVP